MNDSFDFVDVLYFVPNFKYHISTISIKICDFQNHGKNTTNIYNKKKIVYSK